MNNKIEKQCNVCKHKIIVSQGGNGECFNCGWYNNILGEENENTVVFPNLISLNKAKKLYKENKPLKPDLNDFLDGLCSYREMQFSYNNLNCCVFVRGEEQTTIEFGWSPNHVYYFKDKEDFIKNAKIDNEYVRDIWDKVENAGYL